MKNTIPVTAITILLSLFLSCHREKPKDGAKTDEELAPVAMKIVIQPFSDFSPVLSDSLYKRIEKINPNIEIAKPIPLPKSAYYAPRNRYRADSLISFLWKRSTTKSVVIGLTSKDISTTKGKVEDWGIMGLAYSPGHSCVVSTFRLDKTNLNEQLFKTAIHELGHTQGLPHCEDDKSCLMRDYYGGRPIDELTGFCRFCRSHLIRKGWNLQ